MDSGADTTQRLVISGAIFLGIAVVLIVGYSLYTKAKHAEGELANKNQLDSQLQRNTDKAQISLTGEASNSASFSYDGLVQKNKNDSASSSDFSIVNEDASVTVPEEKEPTPEEDAIPPEEDLTEDDTPKEETNPAPVTPRPVASSDDRPLTLEEIQAIRQLPIDNSPTGQLQMSLEQQSNGQYKARY